MYIRWSAETVRSSLNSFRKISRPLCKNWYTLFPGNGRNIEANIDYIYCHHSANSKGVQLYKYFFYANKRTRIAKKVKWLGWGNWEKDEERKEVWKKSVCLFDMKTSLSLFYSFWTHLFSYELIVYDLTHPSSWKWSLFLHSSWPLVYLPIPVKREKDIAQYTLHLFLANSRECPLNDFFFHDFQIIKKGC